MGKLRKLRAPDNLHIDFTPSPKQYELWKLLQPECPKCGGAVRQQLVGYDANHNAQYKPFCYQCGNANIPQLILGGGAAGGGKALSNEDLALTPSGFVKMGNLRIGMEVNTPNGKTAKIIAVHPQGKKQLYKITTSDGIEVKCCEDHLWGVKIDGLYRVISMADMRNAITARKKVNIPLCGMQQFGEQYTGIIHPYIIGALLGDGGLTNTITYTTSDVFIVEKILSLLPEGANIKKLPSARYGYIITSKNYRGGVAYSPFKEELRKLNMLCRSDKKRVPPEIMYGDMNSRIQCVQGMMDSDGYVDPRGHCSFSVCNKALAEDFMFMVRSLGAKARLTSRVKSCVYKGERKYATSWNVTFNSGDYNWMFLSLPRQQERIKESKVIPRYVVSIEDAGVDDALCITIDSSDGLFITNDFLVTHNSYLASVWLVSSCIRFPEIRAIVARKTLKSLKESTWNTIRAVIKRWGLIEDVHYRVNNLAGTLTFWNDSIILMLEMADLPSDPNFERFGSMEATICAVDEVSEIGQKAIEVLFSRLRWRTHETFMVSKMLLTTNPTTNWVRSRFVQDDNGDKVETREGEYYIPFSVFDNPDIGFRQTYEAALNKISDQATKERLLYGNWDFVEANDMAIYNRFDGAKHLVTGLKERVYDPTKPLITVWDFNVAPQMSMLSAQIDYDNKKVYVLEEMLGKPQDKENNTPALSRRVQQKLYREKHIGGVDVTGDPSGLQRSTTTEDGINNYTVILDTFGKGILRPKLKLLRKQPPQVTRCEFVNELFTGYNGWTIEIDLKCRKLTEDLIYQLKNEDGTKCKQKVTDPKTGVKYEKYGHLSDCLDYLLCYYLRDSWYKFKSGDNKGSIIATTPAVYDGFNY